MAPRVARCGAANLGVSDGEETSEGERDAGRNVITPTYSREGRKKKESVIESRKWKTALNMQPPQQNPSTPPPLFNRYARHPFLASAGSSENPSVTLIEWWLTRLEEEGLEHNISVGGMFEKEKNQGIWEFTAGAIAKRHEPCTLETKDGIVVFLCGFFNAERTCGNGFTSEACEKFSFGFPYWWEDWNLRCPNMMKSQTGSQSTHSRTGKNPCEDSNVPSASEVQCTEDADVVGKDNAST